MPSPTAVAQTPALDFLRRLTGNRRAEFRDGQLEAIDQLVEKRGRVLCVQRTGWGKSAVYFVATAMLRERGAGPTILVSPLIALMRNQLDAAESLGIHAATVNSSNREDWQDTFDRIEDGEVDLLLLSPERLANPHFRRSFTLSRELDPTKIEASLNNGVLRLHIPKAEEARPRLIEVKVG